MRDVFSKVAVRIMPFLVLLYVVAFLDRVNIGFASLTMNKDLHISNAAYGVAAGMFFIGYLICEVPSNVLLQRFGARVWIARIMVSWGLLSIAMAFASGALSYTLLRTLLGAAEAGFFPGILLYLTMWLPPSRRAGLISLFTFAIPLANVVGGPISTALLAHKFGGELQSWQWLFIMEGIPAVLLGAIVPFVLADSPDKAGWLSCEEKRVIVQAQLAETKPSGSHAMSWKQLLSRVFAGLTVIYFVLMVGLYGLGFWLPRILQSIGASLASIGWLSAAAYGAGGIVAVIWSYHSDATGERKWHLFVSFTFAAVGFALAGYAHSEKLAVFAFALCAAGIFSAMPIFWSIVTGDLSMGIAAVGIALVNSLGNLGGFVGPSWIGWITERTRSFTGALLGISLLLLAAGCISTLLSGKSQPVFQGEPTRC